MTTEKHAPDYKKYWLVFGALMVGTVVTVAVSYVHLPPAPAIALGLLIATIKASLVAAFFMHLKGEKTAVFVALGVTAVLMLGFFLIPLDIHLLAGNREAHAVTVPHAHAGGEAENPAEEHP